MTPRTEQETPLRRCVDYIPKTFTCNKKILMTITTFLCVSQDGQMSCFPSFFTLLVIFRSIGQWEGWIIFLLKEQANKYLVILALSNINIGQCYFYKILNGLQTDLLALAVKTFLWWVFNGNIPSLSDHDLYCCEKVNSSEKGIPEKVINPFRTFAELKIFWRISPRTIMTLVNKEFNYLHLSQEKDFLQRRDVFLWEIWEKVESRILRLMLKTFPISQICDGASPSWTAVLSLLRLLTIFWLLLGAHDVTWSYLCVCCPKDVYRFLCEFRVQRCH